LNSRPYGPRVRVSACKADVLSGESMLLTRLNYRPRPKTRKPCPSRLRFRGSVKSSSEGLSLWLIEDVTAETMIGSQRESLEAGKVLFYPNRDADVHHALELVKET